VQKEEGVRGRLGASGAWLRVGLASATIIAPLISRWNDLRAAERARALADETEARLREMRSWAPWARDDRAKREAVQLVREVGMQMGSHRGKVSTRIWLIGVGVGLVAAGTGAYFLVRRRLAMTLEEPLVDLAVAGANGHAVAPREAPRTTTPLAAREDALAAPAAEPAPLTTATTTTREEPWQPVVSLPGELPGGSTLADHGEPAGVTDSAKAQFIGNIRTMVYHDADDTDLPAEENRIYFASEDEAREAGFRRDRADVAPSEMQSEAPAGE